MTYIVYDQEADQKADQKADQEANQESESWSIALRGLILKGLAWGPRDAPPALAIHGWQDNAASFIPLMSHLHSRLGLRVLAPDLAGHGQSSWRAPGSAYHFIDWLRDLDELLKALGWSQCVIIGHSMGAGIASLWAGLFPERCVSLVLIEGLGPLSNPAVQTPDQLARSLQAPLRPFQSHESMDQLITRRLALTPMKRESAHLLMKRATRAIEGGGVQISQDPALRLPSPSRLTEEQVHAFLSRIICPVLLIIAHKGWRFNPQDLQERQAQLTHYKVSHVEGYHHVHMDHPMLIAELCLEFLSQNLDTSLGG